MTKKGKKKKKRRGEGGLKDTLIKMVPYMTPMMAEHCLARVELDINQEFDIEDEEMVNKLIEAALLCKKTISDLEEMETIPGYIIYEEVSEEEQKKEDDLLKEQLAKQKGKKQAEDKKENKTEEIEKEMGYVYLYFKD